MYSQLLWGGVGKGGEAAEGKCRKETWKQKFREDSRGQGMPRPRPLPLCLSTLAVPQPGEGQLRPAPTLPVVPGAEPLCGAGFREIERPRMLPSSALVSLPQPRCIQSVSFLQKQGHPGSGVEKLLTL